MHASHCVWGLALCVRALSAQDVVAHIDDPPFTLYRAGSNVGVSTGGPVAWLRQPADVWDTHRGRDVPMGPPWFELGPGDSAIAATAADPRLASAPPAQLRVWRTVVAQSAVAPLPTLLALLRDDQTLAPAVATNPRLSQTTSPLASLMALADANDQVAAIVIQNPAAASHPLTLVTLAERHPAIWTDAMRRVLGHLPELADSGGISERAAVHLAFAGWMLGGDSARVAVGHLPAVRRSTMAMTIVALASDTLVREVGLRELIGRAYVDTMPEPWLPPGLANALTRTRAVRADRTLLWALATLDGHRAAGRWRTTRADALLAIASDPQASPEELGRVVRALNDWTYWRHAAKSAPEAPVASALMRNPKVRTDRATMEALAALPISEFGAVPSIAARRLHAMPRGQ